MRKKSLKTIRMIEKRENMSERKEAQIGNLK